MINIHYSDFVKFDEMIAKICYLEPKREFFEIKNGVVMISKKNYTYLVDLTLINACLPLGSKNRIMEDLIKLITKELDFKKM